MRELEIFKDIYIYIAREHQRWRGTSRDDGTWRNRFAKRSGDEERGLVGIGRGKCSVANFLRSSLGKASARKSKKSLDSLHARYIHIRSDSYISHVYVICTCVLFINVISIGDLLFQYLYTQCKFRSIECIILRCRREDKYNILFRGTERKWALCQKNSDYRNYIILFDRCNLLASLYLLRGICSVFWLGSSFPPRSNWSVDHIWWTRSSFSLWKFVIFLIPLRKSSSRRTICLHCCYIRNFVYCKKINFPDMFHGEITVLLGEILAKYYKKLIYLFDESFSFNPYRSYTCLKIIKRVYWTRLFYRWEYIYLWFLQAMRYEIVSHTLKSIADDWPVLLPFTSCAFFARLLIRYLR